MRAVLLVALVAVVVRVAWVLLFAEIPGRGIISDPVLYHAYGLRLADGQGYLSFWGYPTSYYPPGYPFFLGGLYKVLYSLGAEYWIAGVVGIVQAFLWGVTTAAVALSARWAFRSAGVGLAAGAVIALWPNLITYAGAWLSESLFVCLFSVAIAALVYAARSTAGTRSFVMATVIAAAAIAAATMVRPQVLLGIPLVAVVWWWAGVGWRRAAALLAAVAVAVAAVAVPWALRNDAALGSLVFVSTNGGDNLCIGFHPGARGGFAVNEYCETGEGRIDGPAAEVRRNHDARQLAIEHILDEPLSLPWLSVRKLFWTYRTDDDGLRGNESYGSEGLMAAPWRTVWMTVTAVGYALVMAAFIYGVVLGWDRAWRRPRDAAAASLYVLTLVGAVVVPVMFFGDPRFKVATAPLFAIFAGLGMARVWSRARGRAHA